jgi:hypothetical protein
MSLQKTVITEVAKCLQLAAANRQVCHLNGPGCVAVPVSVRYLMAIAGKNELARVHVVPELGIQMPSIEGGFPIADVNGHLWTLGLYDKNGKG